MRRSAKSAPVVNTVLATLLCDERDPTEMVSDALEFLFQPGIHTPTVDELLSRGRLVSLTCGHFKITKTLGKTGRQRCGEMIRSGWDHDGFRNRGTSDTFSWPDDQLRELREQKA